MSADENLSIPDLIQRLREGDSQAAGQLFTRYAQRLLRLAHQHMSRKLAGRLDSEDLIQSAFRSFFRRDAQGEFNIENSAQLWRLLVKITLSKVRAQARHHTAQARDIAVEVPGDEVGLAEMVAREPGPDEAVALIDQIDALLHGLPELHGDVLHMRLEGHSVAEIAARLGVSRQTVYRALELFRQRLSGPG
jgi:RNA polymerase sigma-70 factor (ECF subfamily)